MIPSIAEFAEQLAARISGLGVWSSAEPLLDITLACEAVMIPRHELLTGENLHGVVTPHADRSEISARGARKIEYVLDLGLIKVCQESEIPDLLQLAQSARDRLLGAELAGLQCMESSFSLLYSPDVWLETGAFLSVIASTWRGWDPWTRN